MGRQGLPRPAAQGFAATADDDRAGAELLAARGSGGREGGNARSGVVASVVSR